MLISLLLRFPPFLLSFAYAFPYVLEVTLRECCYQAVLCVPTRSSGYLLERMLIYLSAFTPAEGFLKARKDDTLCFQIQTHANGIRGDQKLYISQTIIEHIGLSLFGLWGQCTINDRTMIYLLC
jgi:hypothetical protein